MADINDTLNERHVSNGNFNDSAKCNAAIQRVFESTVNYNKLADTQKIALQAIAGKISNILSGNPNHTDNWHDIAGYAKLLEIELERDLEFT